MKLSIAIQHDHCPVESGTVSGFWLAVYAQQQDKLNPIPEHVQFMRTRPTARQVRKAVKAFYNH